MGEFNPRRAGGDALPPSMDMRTRGEEVGLVRRVDQGLSPREVRKVGEAEEVTCKERDMG